jgi:hypothetical protein
MKNAANPQRDFIYTQRGDKLSGKSQVGWFRGFSFSSKN